MGREIKRVALDFDWPLGVVWKGFSMPERLQSARCPSCEIGYSPRGEYLHRLWYGKAPFRPEDNGSVPLTPETPAVRAFAERNVEQAPEFYGRGELAIVREAKRLCQLWNGMWCHHLNDDDVKALVDAGRLMDFTHTWDRVNRWQKIEPPFVPTAQQVNEWSVSGLGHDSINAGVVISARCKRENVAEVCWNCLGDGSVEVYPGQSAEAEAWTPTEPPAGDGRQVWETVSEGSPISPVFATREELIDWLCSPAYSWGASHPLTREQAEHFVTAAWAPTMVSTPSTGLVSGDAYLPVED